jgi:hypothetical protein
MVLTVLYQHFVEGYDILPVISIILLYAGGFAVVRLLFFLALLCGRALDRIGVLAPLQRTGIALFSGARAIVEIALILLVLGGLFSMAAGAVASISTPAAVIIGAVIIASAISGARK